MFFNARFFPIFIIFVLCIYFTWEGILAVKNQVVRKPFGWRNELFDGKVAVVIGIIFLVLAAASWVVLVGYFIV